MSDHWLRTARRLSLKLNLGLWLDAVLPIWAGSSLALAAVLLWLRGRTGGPPVPGFWIAAALVLASLGLAQWLRVRASFYRGDDALAWLDDKLGLHNRLGSARAGVGPWPDPPARPPRLLRWRAARLAPPAAFSIALLTLAALVPVPPLLVRPNVVEEPLSWREMERAIEQMREEEIVAEEALEAFEEKLDSLRDQPQEEWFRHGSLEASDSLEEELASEMRALAQGLERVEAAIGGMAELGEGAPPEERRLRGARLRESVTEVDLGRALPLNQKLSRQLKTLAREREIRELTDEELERIRNAKERLYHGLPGGKDAVAIVGVGSGSGADNGSGRAGRGGINRGPGSAPIALSDERTELGTTGIEAVRNEDLRRASFGDTLSIQVTDHDVDVSRYSGSYDAGTVASFGEGGDLVWSQSLTPDERRVLRKYFK